MPGKPENPRVSNSTKGRLKYAIRQMQVAIDSSENVLAMEGEGPEDCDILEDAVSAMCTLIADAETAKIELQADLMAWLQL